MDHPLGFEKGVSVGRAGSRVNLYGMRASTIAALKAESLEYRDRWRLDQNDIQLKIRLI
jgi:hypothetical protein